MIDRTVSTAVKVFRLDYFVDVFFVAKRFERSQTENAVLKDLMQR